VGRTLPTFVLTMASLLKSVIALLVLCLASGAIGLCGAAANTVGQQLDVDVYGNILIVDTDRNTVRLFSSDTVLVREIGGSGWQNDQFDRPSGIWARNGIDVFVADYGNHRIQRFDRNLNYISTMTSIRTNDSGTRLMLPYPGWVTCLFATAKIPASSR
jgi:hypothetical protein